MTKRIRLLVPTIVVAAAVSAASLVLVGATGHDSTPTPGRTTTTTGSACPPAPAACGSDNLDELAIHAAYAAVQQGINNGSFPIPAH